MAEDTSLFGMRLVQNWEGSSTGIWRSAAEPRPAHCWYLRIHFYEFQSTEARPENLQYDAATALLKVFQDKDDDRRHCAHSTVQGTNELISAFLCLLSDTKSLRLVIRAIRRGRYFSVRASA